MNPRTRKRIGMVWLLIVLVGTVAAGKAWPLALVVFTMATLFLLGLERLVKMVLGKQD